VSPVLGIQGAREDLEEALETAAALGAGLLWHSSALFSRRGEVNHDS